MIHFSKNQLMTLAIIMGIVVSVFWRIEMVNMSPYFNLAAIPYNINPLVITSISPTSKLVNASDFVLTVSGSGFGLNPKIVFNDVEKPTTVVSASKLKTTISSADIATAGVVSVLFRTGGGTSKSVSFSINNPAPKITDLDPQVVVLNEEGGADFTLTVKGMGFTPQSVVNMNGVPITESGATSSITEYISSTELKVQIASKFVPGKFNITVTNPVPGGGTSKAKILIFQNPVPVLDSIDFGISQTSIVGGSLQTKVGNPQGALLILKGSKFLEKSTVKFDNATLYPFSWSPTQLSVVIPSNYLSLAKVGEHTLKVFNPGPGGGLSNGYVFEVENPEPTITNVTPNVVAVGSPDTVITVEGSGFIAESDIMLSIQGIPDVVLNTKLIAKDKLRATIPALYLDSVGTYSIYVNTPANLGPGGGASENREFLVSLTRLMIVKNAVGGNEVFNFIVGNGAQVGSLNVASGQQLSVSNISPSTKYSVRENVPAGWVLASKSCSVNEVPTGAQNAANNGLINIAVIAGRTTLCVFNNEKIQPVPTITQVSMGPMVTVGPEGAKEQARQIVVTGTNFTVSSVIRINEIDTDFINILTGNNLSSFVPLSEIDVGTAYNITVFNPAPGGGTSNVFPFTVPPLP